MTLENLETLIASRRDADPATSYTAQLLTGSIDRVGKKVGEEATELAIAAKGGVRSEIIHEAADLLYHTLVLLASTNITIDTIYGELEARSTTTPPTP